MKRQTFTVSVAVAAKSETLAYVDVADRLRRQILAGRLSADRRLPSEAALAAQYGVSRSTVREALRQLSAWGLVVTTRGLRGGSRVARLDSDDVGGVLNMGMHLLSRYQAVTVAELLETREFLEIPAARLAAARRTQGHLVAMQATLVKVRPDATTRAVFEANRAFHNTVLDASSNRVLNLITEPLFQVLQKRLLRDRAEPEFWTRVVKEHTRIFDAIRRGDAKTAGQEMALHLSELRGVYERLDASRRTPS